MLLTIDSKSYRNHMAHQAHLAHLNTAETTPDFRAALTNIIEIKVREKLNIQLIPTPYRVLRWEEVGNSGRWIVRYKEIDGVYKMPDGSFMLLEVKASATKSSLSTGLRQLRAGVSILSTIYPKISSFLVVANLGKFVEGFGDAVGQPINEYFNERNVRLIGWPLSSLDISEGEHFASVIPDDQTSEWIEDVNLQGDESL